MLRLLGAQGGGRKGQWVPIPLGASLPLRVHPRPVMPTEVPMAAPPMFSAAASPTPQGPDPEQVQRALAQVAVQLQEPVVLPPGAVRLSWTVSAAPRHRDGAAGAEHPPIPPSPWPPRWSAKHPSSRGTACCIGGAGGAGRRRGRRRGSGGPCSPTCAGARTMRSRSDPTSITSTALTAPCESCALLRRVSVWLGDGVGPQGPPEGDSPCGSPQCPTASRQRGRQWHQRPHLMAATTPS